MSGNTYFPNSILIQVMILEALLCLPLNYSFIQWLSFLFLYFYLAFYLVIQTVALVAKDKVHVHSCNISLQGEFR